MSRCITIVWLFLGALLPAQGKPMEAARRALENELPQRALWHLEALTEAQRRKPDVLRLEVRAQRGLGRNERVLAGATRLLEAAPDDVELKTWLGEALLGLGVEAAQEGRGQSAAGYREQARDVAREVLAKAPDHAPARSLEAWALVDLGEIQAAVKLAREAAAAAPATVALQLLHADMLEVAGEPGEAIGVLHAAAKALPDAGRLPLHRARIHQRAKQHREAVRALMAAAGAKTLEEVARADLGQATWDVFLLHRDWENTAKFLDTWIATHPDDPIPHWWKGYAAELAGESKTPRAHYLTAWKKSGETMGEAALHLGLLAGIGGDEKKAVKLLARSLSLKTRRRPDVMRAQDALNAIAQRHFTAGRPKKAAEVLEKHAIAADPFDWVLRQNAGFVLREWGSAEMGKKRRSTARRLWKRSGAHYVMASKRILESNAADRSIAQVLNDTGLMFHYHLGQIPKGVEYYREALEYDANYIDALENLGVAAMATKEWEEAIDWFDRALEVDPKRRVSKLQRARAKAALAAEKNKAPGR